MDAIAPGGVISRDQRQQKLSFEHIFKLKRCLSGSLLLVFFSKEFNQPNVMRGRLEGMRARISFALRVIRERARDKGAGKRPEIEKESPRAPKAGGGSS
jgi:hypothetical protein